MSTLTKILIVLLSLLSVYLCSSVVIYVTTATNYKQAYESLQSEHTALQEKSTGFEQQLEEKRRELAQLSDKLDTEINNLKADRNKLEQELNNVRREKTDLDERVKTLAAAALKFEETVGGMRGDLANTRSELDQARAESIKLTKNLDEITASLEEKMAQLDAATAEKKRLLEEKAKLEQRIAGKAPAFEPVTSTVSGPATPAPTYDSASNVPLQGTITAIDGNLATLSIGAADGVEKGMVFHVTQNDNFICDIKITEVDAEVAAGTLQLVQQQPRIGDVASTTW
ncbi:MAG: Chromosome partition protein Smc [Planctomycetes bacterium ADurb.Bin401]|nr:MAG: Chromosome partition protein Smc [Planctomycetes bacterium ADurb.Bin401]